MNARCLFTALLVVGIVSTAKAQTGYQFTFELYDPTYQTDSALQAPTGGAFAVGVRSTDNHSFGLGAFRLRLYYDPAVVAFDSARSACPNAATQPLTSVVGGNYVELSAAGCTAVGTTYQDVASVFLKLSSTVGGMLYLSPDTVFDRLSTDRTAEAEGDMHEVCRAQGFWGDVDGDDKVNSRDALIALSVAVGLPANGFNVARGDLDGDGQVTSRDALAMMSASINLSINSSFRLGRGVAVACAPQVSLPRTLYYSAGARGNVLNGRPGVNGLTIRPALDTVITIVGDSATDPGDDNSYQWRPRPSPSNGDVLFQCSYGGNPYQVCKSNADGSGLVRLTTGTGSAYWSPDWSPAGDSIVYIQDYGIYVMAADGSGPVPIPSSPTVATSVAWRGVTGSRRIAYTTYNYEVRTRSMDAPNDSLILTGSYPLSFGAAMIDWSPDGDSLAFYRAVNVNSLFVTVVRNAPNPARRNRIGITSAGVVADPLWTDQGMLFQARSIYSQWDQLFMRRNNGTVVRVTRGTRDAHFPGMKKTP